MVTMIWIFEKKCILTRTPHMTFYSKCFWWDEMLGESDRGGRPQSKAFQDRQVACTDFTITGYEDITNGEPKTVWSETSLTHWNTLDALQSVRHQAALYHSSYSSFSAGVLAIPDSSASVLLSFPANNLTTVSTRIDSPWLWMQERAGCSSFGNMASTYTVFHLSFSYWILKANINMEIR